ncbi:MAG: hypothetical protein ACR2MD_16945 [Aridibacter sp.]
MTLNKFTGIKFDGEYNLNEIETAYAISLEFDDEVKSYFLTGLETIIQENPEKALKINFWVDKGDNFPRLIHIHGKEINKEFWSKGCESFSNLSVIFTPVAEENICKEPLRSNLELLWKHAKRELPVELSGLVQQFFINNEYPTIEKLRDYLEREKVDPDIVYALIFNKALIMDINNFQIKNESHVAINPNIAVLKLDRAS